MSDTNDTDDRPGDDTDAERTDTDESTTDESATGESGDSDATVKTPTSGDEGRRERATSEGAGSDRTTDERSEHEPTASYATEEDLAALREDVAEFAEDVEERTVERDDLESDLRRYVRGRVRRNHARGWGPYLVLLYGTAMTIAAFYSPHLGGGWAILAMLVIWLSTLGLYTVFVIVGLVSAAFSLPGRLRDRIGAWRS